MKIGDWSLHRTDESPESTFAPVEPEANPAEDDDQSAGHIDLEGHYNAIIKQE